MTAAAPSRGSSAAADAGAGSSDRLRILLVGEPHVGKSLLRHRLCHEVFADAAVEEKLLRASSHDEPGDATIGFAISALVRDSFCEGNSHTDSNHHSNRLGSGAQSPPNTTPTAVSWEAQESMSLYNRREAARWSSPNGRPPQYSLGATNSAATSGPSVSHPQVVELFELGGTRNFQLECLTPIGFLDFDGWCFLYDQDDVESASNLVLWHQKLEQATNVASRLARDDVLLRSSMANASTVASSLMPPLLLIGTKTGGESSRDGHTKTLTPTTADRALPDEAFLDTNWVATRAGSSRTRHEASAAVSVQSWVVRVSRYAGAVGRRAALLVKHLRPSFVLSEGWQVSTARGTWYGRVLEAFATAALLLERCVLLVMATFLFGPTQEVVPLRQYSAQQAIRLLKDTPQCHGHAHVDLRSRAAFEASLEDLLHFFDSLEVRKVRATAR